MPFQQARGISRRTALRSLALGGAAALGAFAAACGQAAAPAAPPAGQQPASSAPTAAAPASATGQPVTLSFWAFNHHPHVQEWTALLDIFHQQSATTQVKLEAMPDIHTKIASGFAAGSAGDVLTIHGKSGQRFIRASVLEAFPRDFADQLSQDFFEGVLGPYSYEGDVFGVPMANNTPGIGMVVNVDHFEEAGITVPERFDSWDQVFDIAKQLTQTDSSGVITRAGLNTRMGHNIQYVMGAMLEQGQEYFDEKASTFHINTAAGVAALGLFADAIFTHKVDSPSIPVASKSVAQGLSSIGMVYIDYIPVTRIEFPDKTFTFVIKPPFAGQTPIVVAEGAWGAQVNNQSQHKDSGLEFMRFLAQRETQLHWVQSQTALPALKELVEDPWYKQPGNEFLQNALATLPDTQFMGNVGDIGKIQSQIWTAVMEDLAAGKVTVEEAASRLDGECAQQLEEFKASEGRL